MAENTIFTYKTFMDYSLVTPKTFTNISRFCGYICESFFAKFGGCGEVCSKEFGVCVFNCTHYRETESQFAMRTRKGNHSTYQGQFYIGNINCTGDELSLSDCTVVTISVTRCNAGHTIVDCTTGNYHSSAVRHSLIPRPHSYTIIVAWE